MVTVKEQLALLPAASVAVQDSVETPTGNDPLDPSPDTSTGVAPQASEAVTVYGTVRLHWLLVAVRLILAGHVITGFTLSFVTTTSSEETLHGPFVMVQRNVAELPLVMVTLVVALLGWAMVADPETTDH